MLRLILLAPRVRSTNVMGTSTTRNPRRQARHASSTWKRSRLSARSRGRSPRRRAAERAVAAGRVEERQAQGHSRIPRAAARSNWRERGQLSTRPPGIHRLPERGRRAPAPRRSGSCSGWCDPSASISTSTSYSRSSPRRTRRGTRGRDPASRPMNDVDMRVLRDQVVGDLPGAVGAVVEDEAPGIWNGSAYALHHELDVVGLVVGRDENEDAPRTHRSWACPLARASRSRSAASSSSGPRGAVTPRRRAAIRR